MPSATQSRPDPQRPRRDRSRRLGQWQSNERMCSRQGTELSTRENGAGTARRTRSNVIWPAQTWVGLPSLHSQIGRHPRGDRQALFWQYGLLRHPGSRKPADASLAVSPECRRRLDNSWGEIVRSCPSAASTAKFVLRRHRRRESKDLRNRRVLSSTRQLVAPRSVLSG